VPDQLAVVVDLRSSRRRLAVSVSAVLAGSRSLVAIAE
jgi:hypothetical protein